MKRCVNCILPKGLPNFPFKGDVCFLCYSYKPPDLLGLDRLKEDINLVLDNFYNNSKVKPDYDCIVPVSGGRDSTYVLNFAHKLGLKILAVNFDNEFSTDIAKQNLKNAVDILGIDLVSRPASSVSLRNLVKTALQLVPHLPPMIAFGLLCGGCGYAFKRFVYEIANQYNVPLIIWGDSSEESSKVLNVTPRPLNFWQKINPLISFHRLKFKVGFKKLTKELQISSPPCKEIHLFDYIPWDRRVIVSTIKEELNWRSPSDSPTTWRIDCKIAPLADALMEKEYGISKIEIGFSNMVRAKKMSRKEALKEIELIKKRRPQKIEELCEDLGVTSSKVLKVFL